MQSYIDVQYRKHDAKPRAQCARARAKNYRGEFQHVESTHRRSILPSDHRHPNDLLRSNLLPSPEIQPVAIYQLIEKLSEFR
jgi:hypothetical protein